MVLSGEEAIAKALLSVRILQGMRKFMDVESETELIRIIRAQEESFETLAVELQEHCYRHDAEQTRRLLTYELCNFSGSTCLSLACMCELKPFIAHPCAQAILSDLWYGGLREGRFVSTKVTLILLGLAVPPFYPFIAFCFASNSSKFLEFKTKEELSAQPQTWEEHQDEIETDSSSSSSSSSSNSSSTSTSRNSHMEDAKTRIIDNFTLATPLTLIRPFSEPTLRNPFFQTSTKETSAVGDLVSLGNDTLDTLNGLQFPTPTRVRTKSDSKFQTISGYAMPQNPSQTSLFLSEFSPTPHLQQQNSTEYSANMKTLEAPQTQLTFITEGSDSHDDLASDMDVGHKDEVKSLPTIQLEGSTITDGEFSNLCASQVEEPIEGSALQHRKRAEVTFENPTVQANKPTQEEHFRHRKRHRNRRRRSMNDLTPLPNGDLQLQQQQQVSNTDIQTTDFKRKQHKHQADELKIVPDNKIRASMCSLPTDRASHKWANTFSGAAGTAPYISSAVDYLGNAGDHGSPQDVLPPPEPHQHQLSWRKKVYEFFSAPVTRFYLHVLLYVVFLLMFICYSLITVPYASLNGLEIYIYLHIITYCIDKFREVNLSPGISYWQKLKVSLTSFWNVYDFILSFFSVIGVIVRLIGLQNRMVFLWGRNILVCCCLFWNMRFLELMQIWHFSGPYIYLIVKMVRAMIPMLSLLFIPLVAFGTLREGIMVMNRTSLSLEAFKNVLLEPYFMLYGEVYAPEIDPKDWGVNLAETPLYQMVPTMDVVYLLYSIVLMLSVIIAVFNSIYSAELAQSELIYKYLRYSIITEYESRPLLPPPFVVFSWIYAAFRAAYKHCKTSPRCKKCRQMCRRCRKWCKRSKKWVQRRLKYRYRSKSMSSRSSSSSSSSSTSSSKRSSSSPGNSFDIGHIFAPRTAISNGGQQSDALKLFLEAKDVEKLHDFEEECVEDYCREKKIEESKQSEVHLGNISSGIAAMEYRLKEVHLRQQQLRGDLHTIHDEVLAGQEEVLSKFYEARTGMVSGDSQNDLLPGGAINSALLGSVVWLLKNSVDRENIPVTEDNYLDIQRTDRSNTGIQRPRQRPGDNDVTSMRAHCRRQVCQQNRPKFSSKLSSHTEEDDIDGSEAREIQDTDPEVRDYSTERISNRGSTRQAQRIRHEKFRQQRRNAMGLDNDDSDDLERSPESPHTANDWLHLLAERIIEQRNLANTKSTDLEPLGRQQQQRSSQRLGCIRHRSSLSQSPSLSAQAPPIPYSRRFDGIRISPSSSNNFGTRNSHRAIPTIPHIAANREYTTILDDIDISQLLQPDSPTTSPMGSRTDLQQIPAVVVNGPATAKHGKRRRGTRFAIPPLGAYQQPGFELEVPGTKRTRHRHHRHRERRSPSVPTFTLLRDENESPIASTSLDHLVHDVSAMSHQLCRSSFSNAHPPSVRSSQNFLDEEMRKGVSDEKIFITEKEDNQLGDADSSTPKDPLHLAEAAEWNELEGVVIRRLRQLSVAMEEEVPPPVVPPQDESEYCDDGTITIPHIADTQTSTKNNPGTSDDVWNAAATALEEATTHGVEVVDPDLDLDYIPPEVPMVADSLYPMKPTSPNASMVLADGSFFSGEESGGTSNRRHHLHRFYPPHHSHN